MESEDRGSTEYDVAYNISQTSSGSIGKQKVAGTNRATTKRSQTNAPEGSVTLADRPTDLILVPRTDCQPFGSATVATHRRIVYDLMKRKAVQGGTVVAETVEKDWVISENQSNPEVTRGCQTTGITTSGEQASVNGATRVIFNDIIGGYDGGVVRFNSELQRK